MSFQVRVSIENEEEVLKALARFNGGILTKLAKFLKAEGGEMERELRKTLEVSARAGKGPRGGQLWKSSLPGEPPRKRTSNLQNAQGHKVHINRGTGDFALDVGGIRGKGRDTRYQAALEFGTSKMEPRPHLFPIIMEHLSRWPKGIKAVVEEAKEESK